MTPEQWPYTVSGVKPIDASCYYSVLDRRIDLITNRYDNIDLETREFKDVFFTTDGVSYRFRVLKETDEINLSYFIAGEKPDADDEIALTERFAIKNDLEIGDTFDMK